MWNNTDDVKKLNARCWVAKNSTKQNKTKQNKTKQNKTKHPIEKDKFVFGTSYMLSCMHEAGQ